MLLGGFQLTVNEQQIRLPTAGRRLIALCALQGRAISRTEAAGLLWPSEPECRASSNLRTTLWRLPRSASSLVEIERGRLRVGPRVLVDVTEWRGRAERVLLGESVDDTFLDPAPFSFDLLPGWYSDEWLYVFQERWRQLRLHALEAIARRLTTAGRFAAAIDTALQAVAGEPLRESAQRVLIEAHLAEGNVHEACRQLVRYELLLAAELGVRPSAGLIELVHTGAMMA
jgi:DNA-binding SARP family transcriptional activator